MRILLTGACGLVGRAILRAAGDEHTFVPFDLSENVGALDRGVRASVTDRAALFRAAEGCDAIIHTAALHGGNLGKATHEQFIQTNVIGADHLFAAALEHGIRRVVCSSSLDVLCGKDWQASGITVYNESMPARPDTIYAQTKWLAEQVGHFYALNHQLEVIQLRYVWVRNVPMEKIALGLLARSIADSDVASANLLAATTPGLTDHVLLIGPGAPLGMKDVMEAQHDPWQVLERHWPGSSAVLQRHGKTPRSQDFWPACCIDAARQLLGWEPKVTFTRYLQHLGWTGGEPAADAGAGADADAERSLRSAGEAVR